MAIDHLNETIQLPFDRKAIESGDPRQLGSYLYELVKFLEDLLAGQIATTVNMLVDTNNVQWRYFAAPDPATGAYAVGTYRLGQTSNGVELQELVGTTWTKRWGQG